jgi:peroxiredoxin
MTTSVLALVLVVAGCVGEEKPAAGGADLDAEIAAEMDAAWDEVRAHWDRVRLEEATEEDDPQPELARGFYRFYVAHSGKPAGDKALETAFAMWGNVGAIEEIEDAIPTIDPDSEVWASILNSIGNAYARNERWEDYRRLRAGLEGKLTHPRSQSELFLDLAEERAHEKRTDEARDYYERIIALDADPFYVDRAKGNLYELSSLNEGDPAPELAAEDLDGNAIKLSTLRGNVVLIEFWSTTCGPCIPEIAHLKKIHTNHGGADFALLGVALDEKADDVRDLLEREAMEWPQILESERFEGEVSAAYNVYYIPRSFLIDAEGRIIAKDLRGEDLERAVSEALGQPGNHAVE